jgi:hypothetical protein
VPAHLIDPHDGQQTAMQDDELLAKYAPDDKQRFDQHSQVGQVLDQLIDACQPGESAEVQRIRRLHGVSDRRLSSRGHRLWGKGSACPKVSY